MPNDTVRNSIVAYCAAIGRDPLLVQGAGGNVSWKDGDTLWIKASGTWLADAADKDIFVPVDLAMLRASIVSQQFSVTPVVLDGSSLRPSIETLLHALMPQAVVVHAHAIDALAHLVRADWPAGLAAALTGLDVRWATVPYRKPGAELAAAVGGALAAGDADVLFLQNHGIVIGADDVGGVADLLECVIGALRIVPAQLATLGLAAPVAELSVGGITYRPLAQDVHALATDPLLFARLASEWALFPDHVVFLGAAAHVYPSTAAMLAALASAVTLPELCIVEAEGVYATDSFSLAKQVQLQCYYDVLLRQPQGQALQALDTVQIGELLNWDSEQYRMRLAK